MPATFVISISFVLQMASQVSMGGYHNPISVKQPHAMNMLKCKICKALCRDAYTTKCCKKAVCKSCIDKSCHHNCPMCGGYCTITKAIQIDQVIQVLDVYCDYQVEGCKWMGKVEKIDDHLKVCLYLPVPCEYHIVGCTDKTTRLLQADHNTKNMKQHFLLVSNCAQELSNTQQQVRDSENKLSFWRVATAISLAVGFVIAVGPPCFSRIKKMLK